MPGTRVDSVLQNLREAFREGDRLDAHSLATRRYNQLYDNDLYLEASAWHDDIDRKNALIDAAMILCGAPTARLQAGLRLLVDGVTSAEQNFLKLFI